MNIIFFFHYVSFSNISFTAFIATKIEVFVLDFYTDIINLLELKCVSHLNYLNFTHCRQLCLKARIFEIHFVLGVCYHIKFQEKNLTIPISRNGLQR
jgi:hypothetical protein